MTSWIKHPSASAYIRIMPDARVLEAVRVDTAWWESSVDGATIGDHSTLAKAKRAAEMEWKATKNSPRKRRSPRRRRNPREYPVDPLYDAVDKMTEREWFEAALDELRKKRPQKTFPAPKKPGDIGYIWWTAGTRREVEMLSSKHIKGTKGEKVRLVSYRSLADITWPIKVEMEHYGWAYFKTKADADKALKAIRTPAERAYFFGQYP